MAMQRMLFGLAILPFLVGVASAAQSVPLNDAQMDAVTAGAGDTIVYAPAYGGGGFISAPVFLFRFSETDVTNTSTVMVNIDPVSCTTCYLNIQNESFTVQAQFGPQ
jgi:hypothetical protein